jgi:hypothetical protein
MPAIVFSGGMFEAESGRAVVVYFGILFMDTSYGKPIFIGLNGRLVQSRFS